MFVVTHMTCRCAHSPTLRFATHVEAHASGADAWTAARVRNAALPSGGEWCGSCQVDIGVGGYGVSDFSVQVAEEVACHLAMMADGGAASVDAAYAAAAEVPGILDGEVSRRIDAANAKAAAAAKADLARQAAAVFFRGAGMMPLSGQVEAPRDFDLADGVVATSCPSPRGEVGDHFTVVVRGAGDLAAIVAEGEDLTMVHHSRPRGDGSILLCCRLED